MKKTASGQANRLLHGELTDRILKNFFDVYNELGQGFLESVYRTALAQALRDDGLNVETEARTDVFFRGKRIGYFEADIVVEQLVVLELKAVRILVAEHFAQLINYLCATTLEVGLVLSFGRKAEFKRLIYSNSNKQSLPR